ncbi:MAG: peptidoglycan-binding protein [Chthoniobacterales bacterium]|nr:peptidoglycan-binding protein [Chthoniobacterales bacterium]
MRRFLALLLLSSCLLPLGGRAESFSFYTDSLAPRDDFGLLHQSPHLNPTDFAPRYPTRCAYYLTPSATLVSDMAYVGALQTSLYRHGYYCGPIDGVFSAEVSVAIARMQKNYSQRVTGTLTMGVRRALYLP